MVIQSLPRSADRYAREQRAEIRAAVLAVRRQWARMTPEFDVSYRQIEPTLVAVVAMAQGRVAAGAQAYVPAVLEETGQTRAVAPVVAVRTSPLVGVAGDGRPVESLLYGAVTRAKQQVYVGRPWYDEDLDEVFTPGLGRTPRQALASSGQWLTTAVGTLLSDTGRQSESLAMGVRPVGGYVRMLNPPSCSRCAVLAGKWYRKNAGFQRHPGCDCRHIPASESIAGDLVVDSGAYFESLSAVEQDQVFTKAGAEAIRSGADLNQVVNARRGMQRAQFAGRDILATTEGTTRRGRAYNRMSSMIGNTRQEDIRRAGQRYFSRRSPRLMPEEIQRIATDQADYLRLLRTYGYA